MHPSVMTIVEGKRGCGYRHNGLYLKSDNTDWMGCGKLPVAIDKPCPVCGSGIRITRGLQKVNWKILSQNNPCKTPDECSHCLANVTEYAWLMSVGEKFYKTPGDFTKEALEMGISKRIHAVPRGFKVGESVVLLCHKYAVTEWQEVEIPLGSVTEDMRREESLFDKNVETGTVKKMVPTFHQGIFAIFKPTRLEYVVKGDETDAEIERLIERGIVPVKVVHERQLPMEEWTEGEDGLLSGIPVVDVEKLEVTDVLNPEELKGEQDGE
jgi:hypothetical protein